MKQSGYFPVSLGSNTDHGLGFGQGSMAGVYNQYHRGGFHRPSQFDELDLDTRHKFNLKGCTTYKCHYDPDLYMYRYNSQNSQNTQNSQNPNKESIINDQINTVVFLIIFVIVLFFIFGHCFF